MPTLTLGTDHSGKPVIELYVGVGLAKSASLRESGQSIPVPRSLRALVDTGASRTVIEEEQLRRLELSPLADEDVHTASTGGAPVKLNVYAVELSLAEAVAGTLARNLPVLAAADLSGLGVQVLLGRDVLGRVHFHYNGPGHEFSLEFIEEAAVT